MCQLEIFQASLLQFGALKFLAVWLVQKEKKQCLAKVQEGTKKLGALDVAFGNFALLQLRHSEYHTHHALRHCCVKQRIDKNRKGAQ